MKKYIFFENKKKILGKDFKVPGDLVETFGPSGIIIRTLIFLARSRIKKNEPWQSLWIIYL